MLVGAQHFRGHDAGQAFTGPIPDHDLPLWIQYEGGNDQMLHQAHGVSLRDVHASCGTH